MSEVWRNIPSIPGWAASSYGRVVCLPFFADMPNGGQRRYGGKPTLGVWDAKEKRYQVTIRDRRNGKGRK